MQQVRNELVVALEVQIADVEENDIVTGFATLAQNLDRPSMALEKRVKMLGDKRQLDHFCQRTIRQFWNNSRREAVLWRGLDNQRELSCGLDQFHSGFRRWI